MSDLDPEAADAKRWTDCALTREHRSMPSDADLSDARPEVVDAEIATERTHLDESRAALHRMRERTAAMSALAGDRVSGEYLKFTLWKRMKALEDDPEIPLFFGRLDYDDAERFYIGRRHVTDEDGDPLVVDWRAPISRPFYRASRTDPLGVRLRRRFGFQHGTLTAYEDERLGDAQAPGVDALHSELLEAEIERPRIGPMRDIVATIQPEQDDIVRADLAASVCVQGAPGTGKTAVGLHRAAYLLYTHRDQLNRQGVLVVGPNDAFLRYIGDVLPALGEIDARQTTVEELVGRVRPRAVDAAPAARIKGDARMAQVLARAVWSHVQPAAEGLVVPRGARRWRVPAYEADELVAELRARGVRYATGRAMLAHRLAHTVLVKMELAGESPDDRVQDAVARSRPVRQYVDGLWPALDAVRVVMLLLGDRDFLATAADGVLSADEQAAIRWARPAKGPASAPWTVHDAVLIDETTDLLERTPSLGHVVLDEAQDLSAMMLRSVGRRCSTGSSTVLGDLAQATTPWSVGDWAAALTHLGQADAHVEELTIGFRVPADVIDYAARLLPLIAPTLAPPTSIRRAAGDLSFRTAADAEVEAASAAADIVGREGSIGVIVPDASVDAVSTALDAAGIRHAVLGAADDMEAHVDLVPATLAKGLEFDHVVLVEPSAIAAAEPDQLTGLRRLYVCLTRAVMSLVVVHSQPLPEALARPHANSDR
jgi:DNA helicase IV